MIVENAACKKVFIPVSLWFHKRVLGAGSGRRVGTAVCTVSKGNLVMAPLQVSVHNISMVAKRSYLNRL